MKAGRLSLQTKTGKVLLLCVILVVSGAGLFAWLSVRSSGTQPRTTQLPSGMDTDINTTARENIPQVIEASYKVRYKDLQNKSLKSQVNSFEMAMDLTVAFKRDGNKDKAYEAYQVADTVKSKADDTVDFRTGYCNASYAADNVSEAKRQCTLAKERLSSITDTDQRAQAASKIDAIAFAYEEQT